MSDFEHIPRHCGDADERSWTAWLYLLGELSEADASRFETEMEQTVEACEALAEATRTLLALQAARPTGQLATDPASAGSVPVNDASAVTLSPPAPLSSRRPARQPALAVAAASIAVLAAAWGAWLTSPAVDVSTADGTSGSAAELVHRWRDGGGFVRPTFGSDAEFEVAADGEEGMAVPSWLLAAVSLEDRRPQSSDDVWEDN